MKKFVLASLMVLAANSAFAETGGGSAGDSEQGTNLPPSFYTGVVVGGCAAVESISGENSQLIYTGPCNSAPTAPTTSDFATVFPTQELAAANCDPRAGYVQSVISWNFQVVGYVCAPQNNSNGQ